MSTHQDASTSILEECSNEECHTLHQYLTAREATGTLEYEEYAYPLRCHAPELVGKCETPSRTLYTAWTAGDYFTTATIDTATGEMLSFVDASDIRELYGLWLEWGLSLVSREESPFKPMGAYDG